MWFPQEGSSGKFFGPGYLCTMISLIALRELNAKLRTRSFVISTAISIAVLAGFVLMQSNLGGPGTAVVGLNGQAIAIGGELTRSADRFGHAIETREITDPDAGAAMVDDGDLDALVTGPPAGLRVLVKHDIDPDLRVALDGIVQQEVLKGRLATVEDLDVDQVLETVTRAGVGVRSLRPADPQRDERLAIALLIIGLLYVSLVLNVTMVAQGVVEEKSNRVVELLLSTVRPRQLLAGKVLGLGAVGLIQLAVIGGVGLLVSLATGVLTVPGLAAGTLLWALVWYLLGFFLYATVFAAAAALVSRQEEVQAVVMPITLILVLAFIVGFAVAAQDEPSTTAVVLSLIPPLSPMLLPGQIALGTAQAWQVAVAIVLTLATTGLLTVLGGRIYANSVLRIGSRVRLRDALR
jgi:ABC-2 type transport system permease protein